MKKRDIEIDKNKLKKNIMEKNWIKKIIEVIRVAMNKGLNIDVVEWSNTLLRYCVEIDDNIQINIYTEHIVISTSKGRIEIQHKCTDRENLELQAMKLSIKEYREDMAISELEDFISEKKEGIVTINDLDNEDD